MTEEQRLQMEAAPFPISFSCVDMILTIDSQYVVFIKKSYKDDYLRLPGGIVDPTDLCVLNAAIRELKEEVNADENLFTRANYTGQDFLTADVGRYAPGLSKHRLRTSLFDFDIRSKEGLEPLDDADGIEFVHLDQLYDLDWVTKHVAPGHIPLIYFWLGTVQNG